MKIIESLAKEVNIQQTYAALATSAGQFLQLAGSRGYDRKEGRRSVPHLVLTVKKERLL